MKIELENNSHVKCNEKGIQSVAEFALNKLGIHPDSELAKLAPESTQVVELVPAFNGLGAPWWDREATGIITGLQNGRNSRSGVWGGDSA